MSQGDGIVKAQYLWDNSIALSGRHTTLVFGRIWAGVGWPDTEQGALCVLGESLEGVYHAVGEWRGSLFELGSAAEVATRDFLVECFLIDASDEVSTAYIRRTDHLGEPARAPGPQPRLWTKETLRPRAAASTTVKPVVVGVRTRYRENFRAALETVRGIAAAHRLAVHQDLCPGLTFALRRDLDYMLKSPVIKALVWVLTAMESTRNHGIVESAPQDPWYHNVPR